MKFNGWLLEQAALSRTSGFDPVEFVLRYLNPALVALTLLAPYALARVVLKSASGALLAGCLYALFFLINLRPTIYVFGGEFISRIGEDKFTARFVFLPVALCLASLSWRTAGRVTWSPLRSFAGRSSPCTPWSWRSSGSA